MSSPSDATQVLSDVIPAAVAQTLEVFDKTITTKLDDTEPPSLTTSLVATHEPATPNADGDQTDKGADPNVNAPEPAKSTATDTVEPDKVSEPAPKDKGRDCKIFTLTLVRHGQVRVFSVFLTLPQYLLADLPPFHYTQSMGNVFARPIYTAKECEEDPLTERGKYQAKSLGEKFKNVRIDKIISSTYARATQTAQGIVDEHCEPLTIEEHDWLIEREIGDDARSASIRQDSYSYNRLVNGWGRYPNFDRHHTPPGGESLNTVQKRAQLMLWWIAKEFGKSIGGERAQTEEWSKLREHHEDSRRCKPDDIPEDIPHIVIVSHNIFLCEFYELLLNWDPHKLHNTTSTDYGNTEWYVSNPSNVAVCLI